LEKHRLRVVEAIDGRVSHDGHAGADGEAWVV
jgi:hypothetical protein